MMLYRRTVLDMSNAPQGTALLRIPEVAAELRVTRSTVYRYIADGSLPVINIGRVGESGQRSSRSRVTREALDAFIAASGREAS
jgi:excisionase family DNA binding protein